MKKLNDYTRLIRLDKPIGTLLLLWPTLTALWLASEGLPRLSHLLIFCLGTFLMRCAGCIVNDCADVNIDKHVRRTMHRPLVQGVIYRYEAWIMAALLALLALGLVLFLNRLTQKLAIIAVFIAVTYPYFKRFFPVPQAYLGIAFGFGIPMAYAAVQNTVPAAGWSLLIANIFWTIAYDTEYAMVDREDDLKCNIYTSAITFGHYDVIIIMVCYAIYLGLIGCIGLHHGLHGWFIIGWVIAMICALYHYRLIRTRERDACFMAFKHNHWLGIAIWVGVILDYGWTIR